MNENNLKETFHLYVAYSAYVCSANINARYRSSVSIQTHIRVKLTWLDGIHSNKMVWLHLHNIWKGHFDNAKKSSHPHCGRMGMDWKNQTNVWPYLPFFSTWLSRSLTNICWCCSGKSYRFFLFCSIIIYIIIFRNWTLEHNISNWTLQFSTGWVFFSQCVILFTEIRIAQVHAIL